MTTVKPSKVGDIPASHDLVVNINGKTFFHYLASGLDNIYLENGVNWEGGPGCSHYTIHDIEGLHRAISMALVCETRELSGHEFRFLRKELGLTQSDFSGLANVDVQTVARWEKGHTKGFGPGDRVIRMLYLGNIFGIEEVRTHLRRLFELDAENHRKWIFQEKESKWNRDGALLAA